MEAHGHMHEVPREQDSDGRMAEEGGGEGHMDN